MATATQTFKNFIDGESVDAAEGAHRRRPQPGHRRGDRRRRRAPRRRTSSAPSRPRARAFEGGWGTTTPGRARAGASCKLADALEEHADEIAELESANAGKPIEAFKDDEVPAMVDNLRFFAGAARCMEGKAAGEYLEGYTSMIRREPVGVIGQIAPWNYPLMMAVWKIGPALATGNTIVLKPAPDHAAEHASASPRSPSEFLPKGVLNVIAGGNDPGAALVEHDDVDMVSLTGSVETGKWIAEHAAKTLKQRPPRAGRQGAGRRVRRRRHRRRARDDRRHRLLQRRPGLHRGHARARLQRDPTTTSSAGWPRRPTATSWATPARPTRRSAR